MYLFACSVYSSDPNTNRRNISACGCRLVLSLFVVNSNIKFPSVWNGSYVDKKDTCTNITLGQQNQKD